VKDQIYIGGLLVDFAARGYKAELLPKDGDNFKIKLTSADGVESTYFIDGTTYYITKMTHKGYISESDFNGQKIVQCCTDKGGWAINPFGGGSTAQPIPDEEYKAEKDQIYIGGPLVDYAARGYKAELLPKDGDNFKIKLTSPDNLESTYFIDGTTYYITKMTHKGFAQGQEIEITSTFSNYKKTDFGYVMPFKIDLDLGQFQLSYVVNKVDINKEIDPAIFDMPK